MRIPNRSHVLLSIIGGNFVRMMTVRDVRCVHCSEVRGVRISEVEMYGVHAVFGRGHTIFTFVALRVG